MSRRLRKRGFGTIALIDMTKHTLRAVAAGVLLILAGCATPQARIKKRPDLFASFPPEVQANVIEGKIELGYTKDMVWIAMGRPDRVYRKRAEVGESEIWAYVQQQVTTERLWAERTVVLRDKDGKYVYEPHVDYVPYRVEREREYEAVRIEFFEDRVRSIEDVQM